MSGPPSSRQIVHVVGVAGVGMSALAQVLPACGYAVTGSDRFLDQGEALETLDRLKHAGVRLFPQDGSGISPATGMLALSTAIESDNPDLLKAEELAIPVLHRAEMLARCCQGRNLLAVAGTSGKTTVTGMIGWLLEQGGQAPFVVNGGPVIAWENDSSTGSVRPAAGELWVIEADESDRSFLHFSPAQAIITNLSRDHFSLTETAELFRRFAARVTGRIVCTPEVAKTLDLPPDQLAAIDRSRIDRDEQGWFFHFEHAVMRVRQPGRHNAENALLAATQARQMGLSREQIRTALASFPGIRRRLEIKGRCRDADVFDDYAHNPEKIRAAWLATAETHDRVLGVWRPHGFGPLVAMRTELLDMFAQTLRPSDALFVLPVYYAGGTAVKSYTAQDFAEDLHRAGIAAEYAESYPALRETLLARCREGTAVLLMGARDPALPRFAGELTRMVVPLQFPSRSRSQDSTPERSWTRPVSEYGPRPNAFPARIR